MLTIMAALFFVTLAGIIVNSVIVRYSTLQRVRVITPLIVFIASLPLSVVSIVNLASQSVDPTIKIWSLGVLGALLAFWFKHPLRGARD